MKKFIKSAGLLLFLFAAGEIWAENGSEKMPVKAVKLYTSGTGFFLREGTVTGNEKITLKFSASNMDDLLKSMIVTDENGGKISGIEYTSSGPAAGSTKSFTVDLSWKQGLPELLSQAAGQEIKVTSDKTYTGKILSSVSGTEKKKAVLSIITEGNRIISLPFEKIKEISFTDDSINRELNSALKILASAGNNDKKEVTVSCTGKGKRSIKIMYTGEVPVWKMSYRLVLGKDGKNEIQGWAIAENTSDEDWKNVSMELICGNPFAFSMKMYEPFFNPRNVLPYHAAERRTPPVFEKGYADAGLMKMNRALMKSAASEDSDEDTDTDDINESVEAAAEHQNTGDFFSYRFSEKISLEKNRSIMLPVVGSSISGEKILIFGADSSGRHPVNAVILSNDTGTDLAPGPVSVFEDGSWAGDAMLPVIHPDGKSIISFSTDSHTKIFVSSKNIPEYISRLSIKKGLLYTEKLLRRERIWTIASDSGNSAERLIIEHRTDYGWQVTSPSVCDERTENLYRFSAPLPEKNRTGKFTVIEERPLSSSVGLADMSSDKFLFYIQQKTVSQEVKAALEKAAELKGKADEYRSERASAESSLALLLKDQERIRGNMRSADRSSDIYLKYEQTLAGQESKVRELNERIEKLKLQESAASGEFRRYINSLDVR